MPRYIIGEMFVNGRPCRLRPMRLDQFSNYSPDELLLMYQRSSSDVRDWFAIAGLWRAIPEWASYWLWWPYRKGLHWPYRWSHRLRKAA